MTPWTLPQEGLVPQSVSGGLAFEGHWEMGWVIKKILHFFSSGFPLCKINHLNQVSKITQGLRFNYCNDSLTPSINCSRQVKSYFDKAHPSVSFLRRVRACRIMRFSNSLKRCNKYGIFHLVLVKVETLLPFSRIAIISIVLSVLIV